MMNLLGQLVVRSKQQSTVPLSLLLPFKRIINERSDPSLEKDIAIRYLQDLLKLREIKGKIRLTSLDLVALTSGLEELDAQVFCKLYSYSYTFSLSRPINILV